MKDKFVIVPQADIDKIEEARLNLWKLHDTVDAKIPALNKNHILEMALLKVVSQPMWEIAHKRYKVKKSVWEKILDFFKKS